MPKQTDGDVIFTDETIEPEHLSPEYVFCTTCGAPVGEQEYDTNPMQV
jgi:hypothetical protein